MSDEIKYCKFCNKEKPIKEFVKSGFAIKNICRECQNKKQAQIYRDSKKIKEQERENQELKKQLEEKESQQKEFLEYLKNKERQFDIMGDPINSGACLGISREYKKIIGVKDGKN